MPNPTIGEIDCPVCGEVGEVRRCKVGRRTLYWVCRCGKMTPNLPHGQDFILSAARMYGPEGKPEPATAPAPKPEPPQAPPAKPAPARAATAAPTAPPKPKAYTTPQPAPAPKPAPPSQPKAPQPAPQPEGGIFPWMNRS